ncbi:ROK family protein [Wenxinia saemankumensis]|uniref:Sugar kinase of the NBD/HSP70 family, may contain an N-terminal HTH domain n=1 Tax=Wenxinia saemankumensis TaxID=1447782 RepID=A0A1M6HUY0_9RHOB|nr:ROK family protein [Wenxinia saemankumensis]SHJ26026.1 Sugar kinase of the NBD/HSP70 family, may contain an N-terminal HTH domain [Wenxinia saemankumensis]
MRDAIRITGDIASVEPRLRNLAIVFEAIRRHPNRSRKEIGADMPFSLQSMTNIAQELLDMGLIEELPRRNERGRGNPHRDLRIVARRGYALGIQFRWNACLYALVDLSFGVVDQGSVPISSPGGAVDGYLAALVEAIGSVLARHRDKDIWGIGLSGPLPIELPTIPPHEVGAFDPADALWFRSFFETIGIRQIRERIGADTGLPVMILNNPQAAALIEAQRLPADARFVSVQAGFGLGASFVNRGSLSRDVWPHGGEIGHIILDGRTVNATLSASAVRRALDLHLPQGDIEAELDRRIDQRPQDFRPWLEEAAPIMRFLVNFIEAAIWPDGIAISGFLPDRLIDLLIAQSLPLADSVVMREGDPRRRLPRIFRARAGASAIPVGAAVGILGSANNPDFPAMLAARRVMA